MSVLLDGVGDGLELGSAPLTGPPLTLVAWAKSTTITANQDLVNLGTAGSDNNRQSLHLSGGVAGDPVQMSSRTASASTASTSTAYPNGVWCCAIGVLASDADRRAYLDGGGEGSELTSRVVAGINRLRIGISHVATRPLVGRVAEVALFDRALSAGERAALAAGDSPMSLSPPPARYWRLKDNLLDIDGANALTALGEAIIDADHPPVADPPAGFDLTVNAPPFEVTVDAAAPDVIRGVIPPYPGHREPALAAGSRPGAVPPGHREY